MAEVRRAGHFANEAERRVVRELERRLPAEAVIITNLYVPVERDTLEVDAVVVGAHGVMVLEIKDWRGAVVFDRGRCYRDQEVMPDPRPAISHKCKVLYSQLTRLQPVPGVDLATNPFVLFASDSTLLLGNVGESVSVAGMTLGVSLVGEGGLQAHPQRVSLSAQQIRAVADALYMRHDKGHHRTLGNYLLGEPIADSPYEEYWGSEFGPACHRVRLKRHAVDDLVDKSERDERLLHARRGVDALRRLEKLRLRSLPLVYSAFADPADDGSLWTAYEGVHGVRLVEADLSQRDKISMIASAAETLDACHREGVLHRSLSPDCLLLPSGDRVPRILHFDLARVDGQATLTARVTRQVVRAQPEAAPEVRLAPYRASPASDVYALGATAAQILMGTRLSTPDEAKTLARRVRPRELSGLLLRMLDEEPRSRIAQMRTVAETLRRQR
jgi:Nuclease-related domain/Protein kinase domain